MKDVSEIQFKSEPKGKPIRGLMDEPTGTIVRTNTGIIIMVVGFKHPCLQSEVTWMKGKHRSPKALVHLNGPSQGCIFLVAVSVTSYEVLS